MTDVRRADWRFLLPPPAGRAVTELVILGGLPALGPRLREAKVAERVSVTLPQDDTADAVVVLHDAITQVRTALRAVAPGGVFYAEVDRRTLAGFTMTPARLRRIVRRAGLTPTALHWVVPGFEHAKRYLPLDAPGALRWYVESGARRLSLARTAATWVIRALIRTGRLASVTPCFSVTATRSSHTQGAAAVFTHPDVAARIPRVDGRVALVTSGRSEASRVVLLPFGGNASPRAVVKISRATEFNHRTCREHATLRQLQSRLDGTLSRTVPASHWCGHWNGLAVAIESYAPGATVLVSSSRWATSAHARIGDLSLASDWLARFHRQWMFSANPWNACEVQRWVRDPIDRYVRALGQSSAEQRLFDCLVNRADALRGARFPLVLQHRDFGPWNVHRAGAALTVIDWEFDGATPLDRAGPALMDLVYFTTYWTFAARRATRDSDQRRAFEDLFIAPGCGDATIRAARQAFTTYMNRLAVEPGFLPLFSALTWIHQAVASTCPDRGTAAANPYVPYVRILAAHAERVFTAVVA